MKVKCNKCGKATRIGHKQGMTPEIRVYAVKYGVYLCKKCRKEVVFEELKRMAGI
jgi:hypothetical protein